MRYRRRMTNPTPGRKEAKRWCIVATITLIVIVFWISVESYPFKEKQSAQWSENSERIIYAEKSNIQQDSQSQSQKVVGPTDINGMRVMWEKPSKVKGILFVAHGCKHSGTDFWLHDDEKCPECLGLPEELSIKETAIKMGFVVVGISSTNRASMCWKSNSQDSDDVQGVKQVLEQIRKDNGWENVPLYALGASSGGSFVLLLPTMMKIDGVCAQIAANPNIVKIQQAQYPYPPTVFVHMPKDEQTAEAVRQSIKLLNESQIQTLEIKHQPLPITQSFFAERINSIDQETSLKIFTVLKENSWLDEGGYLNQNPRQGGWQDLIKAALPGLKDSLEADISGISEEMNVAYAQHEIVSDYTEQVLEWLRNTTTQS